MTKDRDDVRQMSLDLSGSCRRSGAEMDVGRVRSVPITSARIVPFLDATTIALRRDAIRSVERAGIFKIGYWHRG